MKNAPHARREMFKAAYARLLDMMNEYALRGMPKPEDERGLSWTQSLEIMATFTTYSALVTAVGELANGRNWEDVLHRVSPRHEEPRSGDLITRMFRRRKDTGPTPGEIAADRQPSPGDDAESAVADILRLIEIMKRDRDATYTRLEPGLLATIAHQVDPGDEEAQRALRGLIEHRERVLLDTMAAEIKALGGAP